MDGVKNTILNKESQAQKSTNNQKQSVETEVRKMYISVEK